MLLVRSDDNKTIYVYSGDVEKKEDKVAIVKTVGDRFLLEDLILKEITDLGVIHINEIPVEVYTLLTRRWAEVLESESSKY